MGIHAKFGEAPVTDHLSPKVEQLRGNMAEPALAIMNTKL